MWGIGPFRCLTMKVREQTSTHRYHVGKRQQTLRWCNLEENGRQNFENSSSRKVPKQTTPVPVHVYRILFAFTLAPYQMETQEPAENSLLCGNLEIKFPNEFKRIACSNQTPGKQKM